MIWKTRRRPLDLTKRAMVMGILNVTPDSFSDGGRHDAPADALRHARQMIREGVDIIDIGGESTRPGSESVPAEIETLRTAPVIAALRAEWDGMISIDTSKAVVAEAALLAGADIVNDVSGLGGDPEMTGVCLRHGCGIVIMHMRGEPRTMQASPVYEDVVREVGDYFRERMASLVAAGIDPETLCFDPGIGFGKALEHNLELIRHLDVLSIGGRPVLLGVSRKSFIAKTLGDADLAAREWPTIAISSYAREKGVMIHRVHSVASNRQAILMTEAILGVG